MVLFASSELSDTMRARYVHVARARAIPEGRLVGMYALRPALVPVLTFVAANFGQLLTGLIIVEGVFGMPGVGGALFGAIQARDPALLIGLLIFSTTLVLVANFLADVLQSIVDPRVRLDPNQR